MSHIIEKNTRYYLVIDVKEQVIYDSVNTETKPSSFFELVSFKDEFGKDLELDENLVFQILNSLQKKWQICPK